jgi:hypothetical protein
MNNNFLPYTNTSVIDGYNNTGIYYSNINDCISECNNNINCQGVNITNPICDPTSITYQQCVKSQVGTSFNGVNPDNFDKYYCKTLNDIYGANLKLDSETNSFLKKNNVCI